MYICTQIVHVKHLYLYIYDSERSSSRSVIKRCNYAMRYPNWIKVFKLISCGQYIESLRAWLANYEKHIYELKKRTVPDHHFTGVNMHFFEACSSDLQNRTTFLELYAQASHIPARQNSDASDTVPPNCVEISAVDISQISTEPKKWL